MKKVDEVQSKSEEGEMEINEDSDSSTTKQKRTTHSIEESAQKYEVVGKKRRNCFCEKTGTKRILKRLPKGQGSMKLLRKSARIMPSKEAKGFRHRAADMRSRPWARRVRHLGPLR